MPKLQIPYNFTPRDYQIPLWDALQKGCKRAIARWHRRSGKDVTALNWMIKRAFERVGDYYYIFPSFAQGRKVIWDATNNDGFRIIDYFPRELIAKKNENEMKIRLKNGSLFQIVGSDNYDALMGTNFCGAVFSEFAIQIPTVWDYIRPILTANDGWALFISTPRGKNHFYSMWERQKHHPEWFCQSLSVQDTGLLTETDIDKERLEGMEEDMIQQEYYCSFELGVEGSYYARLMNQLETQKQFCRLPPDPLYPVHTAWDIGTGAATSIIFFQRVGKAVHIIDCYEANNEGLPHFVNVLQQRGYTYGTHVAPHDIIEREWSSGLNRMHQAHKLGIHFERLPKSGLEWGQDEVRAQMPFCYFDFDKTLTLRQSLINYRRSFNPVTRDYSKTHVKDWSTHFADAFRYMSIWCRSHTDLGEISNRDLLEKRAQLLRPW